MARHIKYLALAHQGKVLGDYLHWDKDTAAVEKYEDVLKSIFQSPGWAAVRDQRRNKLELKSGQNVYCMEIDAQGRVYIAVITSAYPIRYIFSAASASAGIAGGAGGAGGRTGSPPKLMSEFAAHVTRSLPHESVTALQNGLKRTLRPFLKDLASHFDDLEGLDKAVLVTTSLARASYGGGSRLGGAGAASLSGYGTSGGLGMGGGGFTNEQSSLLASGGGGAGTGSYDEERDSPNSTHRSLFQRGSHSMKGSCRCCPVIFWRGFFAVFIIILIACGVVLGLNYGKFHWF